MHHSQARTAASNAPGRSFSRPANVCWAGWRSCSPVAPQPSTISTITEAIAPPVERFNCWSLVPTGGLFALLVATAGGYGFHRDELYFMVNAQHPAWGYVDHPPLTPMVGWLSQQIFGDTVRGLRTLPALIAALTVVVVALICRELGGSAGAQLLAATAASTTSVALALGHLLTTPTIDVLVWSTAIWLMCRLIRTGDQRWWLAIGTVLGIGLLNKFTVLFAIAAFGLGLLLTPQRRILFSWWLAGGALITMVLWAPHIWWQIDHSWPLFEFSEAVAEDAAESRGDLIPFQILLLGPPVAFVAGCGWWHLARRPQLQPYRFIANGYIVLLVLVFATGGKPYYTAGALPVLLAAGAIAIHRWATTHRFTTTWVLALNLAVTAVIALPLLPQSVIGDTPIADVNPDAIETIGWPSFADQIAAVAATIDPADRPNAVVFTGNYGQAGAIARYGPLRHLPPVYSGHNSFADFGIPPGSTGPVIVIGYEDPNGNFDDCTRAATIHSPHDIDNDENGTEVWLCAAPSKPWADLWPSLRHVN